MAEADLLRRSQYEASTAGGNLSGEEMTRRFWLGVMASTYVTHGETYLDPIPFDESSTPTLVGAAANS